MADRVLISEVEVARLLSVSRYTIKGWRQRRKLPFYRLGKRVLLDKAEVEQFLANGRVEAVEALNTQAA
jgi:excisionase family DNA binding protein